MRNAVASQPGPRQLRRAEPASASVAKRPRGRGGLFEISTLVTPDTLLRWYRRLIANKYDGSKNRAVGRPKTVGEIEELIVRMARQNSTWGYTRIRGALYNLGHEIAAGSARKRFRR